MNPTFVRLGSTLVGPRKLPTGSTFELEARRVATTVGIWVIGFSAFVGWPRALEEYELKIRHSPKYHRV
jgi:hypothetical protein